MCKYNVLIVDDDPNIISSITRLAKGEQFKVSGAHSGEKALHMLNSGFYDLIVTDEMMPGMKGSDLLLEVRKLYPGIIRIMLTGNASLDLAVKLINKGDIYRFFTKPCNSYDLLINIRQALQFKDLLQESYKLLQIVRHQSKIISSLQDNNDISEDKIFTLESFGEDIYKEEIELFIEEIEKINKNFKYKK